MIRFYLYFCSVLYLLIPNSIVGQPINYKLSGYLDTYYAMDNDSKFEVLSHKTRPFSYINKQKDEFRLNIAQLQLSGNYENKVRGIITYHAGDLLHSGWEDLGATDPTLQQANAGFVVLDKFWVDAGYFLTHIGGELLLPRDNWLSSHSLVTYFEPFYQTGVRVSYEGEKLTAQLHLLNGNGIFEDNNYNKSVGVYLGYCLTDDINICYANVIGNEEAGNPENARLMTFHNFDVYYNINPDLKVKGQLDFVTLEKSAGVEPQSYIGVAAEAQYSFLRKHAFTLRSSYINTNNNLFIEAEYGYEVAAGIQYKPSDLVYFRIESRIVTFDDNYKPFKVDADPSSSRIELMMNLGITLE